MGRKKNKDFEEVDLLDDVENDELELSANEDNEDSLELEESSSDNDSSDEGIEIGESEDEKPEKTPKKARAKRTRKRKEPLQFAEDDSSDLSSLEGKEIPDEEIQGSENEEVSVSPSTETIEPPKKSRRPRSTTEEKNLSVAMVSAFEAMTAHWNTAKETTDALVINFEKAKSEMDALKQSSAEPLEKLIGQAKEKQAIASRVTFALSLGAFILSFVSLVLSQSVRGKIFALEAQGKPTMASSPAPISNETGMTQQAAEKIAPANSVATVESKAPVRRARNRKRTRN